MTNKTLTVIQQTITPIAEQAKEITISNDTELKQAVEILSTLNQYNDKITEEKEKVTKPLNEALKAERARWKPLETMYEEAITSIRSKMTSYQTALVLKQKAEEQKIADRISKGTLKIETGIKKLEKIVPVEKEHATEKGLVQFRSTQTLKVTDLTKIPLEYFNLNESKLLKALKEGKQVDGAEIEVIQTPINYR